MTNFHLKKRAPKVMNIGNTIAKPKIYHLTYTLSSCKRKYYRRAVCRKYASTVLWGVL